MKPSYNSVGSGSSFDVMGKTYELKTSGIVTLRCGWTVDQDGMVLCPKDFQGQLMSNVDDDQLGESRKLSDISQLDPNDPRNVETQKVQTTELN